MKTPFELYDFFQISIIQDKIENVSENLTLFLGSGSLIKNEVEVVDFSKVCSNRTIPYNPKTIEFILFEPLTNPGTTVFFPNMTDGWYTLVYNYTRLYKKNAFKVGFTTDETIKYPAYFFKYFYIEKDKIIERAVHAIKEDKWVFCTSNSSLDIEDITNYLKRNIKDRLNNEIIIDYLFKAGYNMKDKNFYSSSKKILRFEYS